MPSLTRSLCAAFFVFSYGLAATGGPAQAAPIYHVYVDGGQGSLEGSSSVDVSRGSTFGAGGSEDNAFAAASPGALRADANTRFLNINPNAAGGRITASALAEMTLDDVIVTGPAGQVTTNYKVHLSGSLEAFASSVPVGASSLAIVDVQLQALGKLLVEDSAVKYNGMPLVGQLANFNGNADLVTPNFTVTANQPFSVVVRLSILAQSTLESSETGLVDASAHFGDTLTFATDGPVFDLPPGYTANSVGGNIVNNQFSPVPEPSSLAAALAGLLSLCAARAPRLLAITGGRA